LRRLFPRQLKKLGTSLSANLSKRTLAPGLIKRYSLYVALAAILLLMVLMYTVGGGEFKGWGSVLGAIFVAEMIDYIYLNALQYTGKLLMKRKP
jgi:hypothetical protein